MVLWPDDFDAHWFLRSVSRKVYVLRHTLLHQPNYDERRDPTEAQEFRVHTIKMYILCFAGASSR